MSDVDIVVQEQTVYKEPILENLQSDKASALEKYQSFFVGSAKIGDLVKFELATMLFGPMPGAVGFLLRKMFYPRLFKRIGSGVNWGRNVSIRHPGKIEIGDRVAIDDDCLLDAKGAGEEGIQIGSDVLIARGALIQGKCSWIKIGDNCSIGSQCQLSSAGGIRFGKSVMIAGQCYIGGGRYRTEDRDKPMMEQELYSKGPVIIGDDVWIGAGVIIQDGVKIGKGCVIGSGAVVREDVPDYTVATPHVRLVMVPRS